MDGDGNGVACAANDVWRYGESPLVGGAGSIPWVAYGGPRERGFDLMAECRGSGPSVYITVHSPGPDLRQLRFKTPIPVAFRLEREHQGKAVAGDEVRVWATLSEGYMAHTDRVRVGIGLQDGAAVASLLGLGTGREAAHAVVEIGKTSATFLMAGARNAFAQLKRSCDTQPR
jgi:hypothetical protein